MINRPNFFIVGFPKCGTTSLAAYLAEHPDILFSRHKEPHYFAFDFKHPIMRRIKTEADYLNQFKSERDGYKTVGEGSTGYVFSEVAVDEILEFAESPKFILAVRNPVDMAVSAHAEMLQSGHEDVENFAAAWRLSTARSRGQCLPKHRTETWHVCYQDFGRVGTKLAWLVSKVGWDRLKVVVFDDLVADPRAVYLDVLEFLGVDDDGRTSFERRRQRRYHAHKTVAAFVNRPPRQLVAAAMKFKRLVGVERLDIVSRLREWNLRPEEKPLSTELLYEMEEHYRPEVELLEELLDRSLGWASSEDKVEARDTAGKRCISKIIGARSTVER